MALNAGAWQRFENGGEVYIGADSGGLTLVDNVVPGSLRFRRVPRENIPNMQRGQYTGTVTPGDQRPQELEFQVWRAAACEGASGLIETMLPAYSSGLVVTFYARIKIPNYDGASAGRQYTYAKCLLNDGPEYQASGSGADVDKITVRIISIEGPVAAVTY